MATHALPGDVLKTAQTGKRYRIGRCICMGTLHRTMFFKYNTQKEACVGLHTASIRHTLKQALASLGRRRAEEGVLLLWQWKWSRTTAHKPHKLNSVIGGCLQHSSHQRPAHRGRPRHILGSLTQEGRCQGPPAAHHRV
eukprot:1155637-Pelagomonas_calceolata.AAC.2